MCNSAVSFLHKRLGYSNYKFIVSQSKTGIEYLKQYNLSDISLESIILINEDKIFVKSNAILNIIDNMSYKWSILRIIKIIPQNLRDWLYDFVSKYRHIFFGKTNHIIKNDNK